MPLSIASLYLYALAAVTHDKAKNMVREGNFAKVGTDFTGELLDEVNSMFPKNYQYLWMEEGRNLADIGKYSKDYPGRLVGLIFCLVRHENVSQTRRTSWMEYRTSKINSFSTSHRKAFLLLERDLGRLEKFKGILDDKDSLTFLQIALIHELFPFDSDAMPCKEMLVLEYHAQKRKGDLSKEKIEEYAFAIDRLYPMSLATPSKIGKLIVQKKDSDEDDDSFEDDDPLLLRTLKGLNPRTAPREHSGTKQDDEGIGGIEAVVEDKGQEADTSRDADQGTMNDTTGAGNKRLAGDADNNSKEMESDLEGNKGLEDVAEHTKKLQDKVVGDNVSKAATSVDENPNEGAHGGSTKLTVGANSQALVPADFMEKYDQQMKNFQKEIFELLERQHEERKKANAASEERQRAANAASEERQHAANAASEERQRAANAASEERQHAANAASEERQHAANAASEERQRAANAASEERQRAASEALYEKLAAFIESYKCG